MSDMVQISFPGIGIEPFTVNKVAFTLFGLEVRWYGILITLGIIMAFAYAMFRSKQEGFIHDHVLDMGLYIVVFGVIGARLYYVLMKLDTFILRGRSFWENLWDMINIRGGGLAIYGGIIAGALTIVIYCRLKKLNWLGALDMIAPGVMIAQAMGRWGNFFNGEAYGGIVSESSWLYFTRMGLYPNDFVAGEMAYVHPTFFYESLWNVIGFILINALLYRRKKFNGQIVLTYFAWYGFGRMFIEGLRSDSLYIGDIRVSQLVGFLCFTVFGAILVWQLIRVHKAKLTASAGEYQPMYSTAALGAAEATASVQEDSSDTAEQTSEEIDENTKNNTDTPTQESESNG